MHISLNIKVESIIIEGKMSDIITKRLGTKIKNQRKRLGISQFELAEMVDIHEKQIYRIETGQCSPSITNILKILYALNIDVRVLDEDNITNFNPVRDEIYSLLVGATDEELVLYSNVIKAIKDSQKITTRFKKDIKRRTLDGQKKLKKN